MANERLSIENESQYSTLVHGYDEIAGSLLQSKIPKASPIDILRAYQVIVESITPDNK